VSPLAGFLAANYGWPSVFYWSGGLSLAVGLLIMFMGADSPANHRWISEAEKDFIHLSLGGAKIQVLVNTASPGFLALV